MQNSRTPEHSIDPLFLDRWSPRSFKPEALPHEDLLTILEAAKWAPSSYNNQPWRFLYAHRDTPAWTLFFNLLQPANQTWVKDAAVLLVIISNTKFDHNGKLTKTHSFDTGSAWENLALQASRSGYVTHGMEGFDYDKARVDLEIPADFTVEAMIALGHQGPKEALPEKLQAMEVQTPRRALAESIAEGKFAPHLLHAEKHFN